MKLFVLPLLLLVAVSSGMAQEIAEIKTVTLSSRALQQERQLLVYTPQSYHDQPNSYYDVVYVLDAHTRELFDYTHAAISFLSGASKKFIVVGITSPYNEQLDYSRNNDFLPVLQNPADKKRFGRYAGNADAFFAYVSTEVIPFVEANYRVLTHRMAIGHSLSASFLLYALSKQPDLFDNYIAISPNLAIDDQRFLTCLRRINQQHFSGQNFLYLSTADEAEDWKEWSAPNQHAQRFLSDSVTNGNIKTVFKAYPRESHWSTFAPSVTEALQTYFNTLYDVQQKELSQQSYEVTMVVTVPGKNDSLYITGNQDALGNWQADKVLMKRISDFERSITLRLQVPAQFKFTRGSWNSEAYVQGIEGNLMLMTTSPQKKQFKVESYKDRNQ